LKKVWDKKQLNLNKASFEKPFVGVSCEARVEEVRDDALKLISAHGALKDGRCDRYWKVRMSRWGGVGIGEV
jgi:hypothetical protein